MHSNPLKEKTFMEEVGTGGIDLAKCSSQVRGARANDSVAFRRKLSQARVLNFLMSLPCYAVAVSLALLLALATDTAAQAQERHWDVMCGLPQEDSFLDLFPTGGYSGPWPGDPRSGHLEVKTLNRPHPEGTISTEMWLLSRSVGWWMLKAIRVHPDDRSKVTLDALEDGSLNNIRQIIESPFLSQPAIVRAGNTDDEDLVTGQIFALLPDASSLRCAP